MEEVGRRRMPKPRVGVRGKKGDNLLIVNPLILSFSLREKGYVKFPDRH